MAELTANFFVPFSDYQSLKSFIYGHLVTFSNPWVYVIINKN